MTSLATVVFADVVGSRSDAVRTTELVRHLVDRLNSDYEADRLAPFDHTQGDEIQGLLAPSADPFAGVLRASLDDEPLPLRWAVVHGVVDPGSGPATQRTGRAFLDARALIERARASRAGLLVATGDAERDPILGDLAPVLVGLLGDMTARQRTMARMTIDARLRQSQVADLLGVSRQTVSTTLSRARAASVEGLADALRRVFAAAVAGAAR